MRFLIALLVCASAVLACGGGEGTGPQDGGDQSATKGLAACPAGTAIFTTSPISLSRVDGWIPLGQVNPPAHTFPTDHQYVNWVNPDITKNSEPADVVAPGDITILRVRRVTYSSDNHSDYSMDFSPCADLMGIFGHITSLDATLLTRIGAFDQQCGSYSPNPGLTVQTCDTKSIKVTLPAGGRIGTAGGTANIGGLDFTLQDRRVPAIQYANPSRWLNNDGFDQFHIVPASEYFTEPLRTQIMAKLGNYNGKLKRTIPPVGGTIAHDIAGTVQGDWMNSPQPTFPETPHLAVVPDNVDPTIFVISMGLSQPSFQSGQYRFTPTSTGTLNRNPSQITPDGKIYCFETNTGAVVLMQLVDATTLRVEGRQPVSTCALQQPYTFAAGATFDYKR
jgi:hypothetical protein